MIPSLKTIRWAFGHFADESDLRRIRRIRRIMDGRLSPLDVLPDGHDAIRYHYRGVELRMQAIDYLLRPASCGCEAIWGDSCTRPDAEYCNLGDAYDPTVLYDYTRGRYLVVSWGDWVEAQERRGVRYN